MIGFGAWWTYFDFAGHRHLKAKPTASLQWIFGHLPLPAAIATMLISASLEAWDRDRGFYRPLARTGAVAAVPGS